MKQYRINITKKHLTAGAFFSSGLFYGAIAGILIFYPSFASGAFNWTVSIAFFAISISNLLEFIFDNKKDGHRPGELILFAIMLASAAFVYTQPRSFLALLPIFIGGYALVNAFIKFVVFSIQAKNHEKNRLATFSRGLFNLLFGLFLMLYPMDYISSALLICAAYFLLLTFNSFTDFYYEIAPPHKKYLGDHLRRRVRITVPAFFTAFIPRQALDAVNDYLLPNNLMPSTEDGVIDEDYNPDFEIFIHVTTTGLSSVGHVDLCFMDTVFTFGGYDNSWKKLFGLVTAGVLVKVEGKENYLNFCTQYSKKSIFGFGLTLTDEQKSLVEKSIRDIFSEVYEWFPKAVDEPDKPHEKDYASALYRNTDSHFFKFKDSHFKTYFMAHTNCVMLADRIIGALGTDVLSINGFITPGTYYNYLDREYRRKNSIVRSKKVYKADEEN